MPLVVLGGVATLAGALALVLAFRHGQAGRRDRERVVFRLAVGALALGSALFLVHVATTTA